MKLTTTDLENMSPDVELVTAEEGRRYQVTFTRKFEWATAAYDPEEYMRSIFRRLGSSTPVPIRDQASSAIEIAPRGFALWTIVEAIRKTGVDQAVLLALTGIAFMGINEENEKLTNALRQGFQSLLEQSKREGWKTQTDYLLSYTYHEQRAHKMTRQEAAELASRTLGKPISMHAWRMRVDRWARDHGFPPIEHRKRKARPSSTL